MDKIGLTFLNSWKQFQSTEKGRCLLLSVYRLGLQDFWRYKGFFLLSSTQLKLSSPGESVPASPPMPVRSGRAAPRGTAWTCGDQSPFGEYLFSILFLQQNLSALGGSVCSLKTAGVADRTWLKSRLSPAVPGPSMLSGAQQKLKLGYQCGKTSLLETYRPEEVSKQSLINVSFLQLALPPWNHSLFPWPSPSCPPWATLVPPWWPLLAALLHYGIASSEISRVSYIKVAGSFGPTFRLCFLPDLASFFLLKSPVSSVYWC